MKVERYESYKNSKFEWLGDVPEHWEVKPLKQYANMIGGFAFSSDNFCEDGIQLLKISNVYNNDLRLDRQPTYLPHHFLKSHSLFRVTNDDIILSLTGTLGKRDYGYAVLIKEEKDFLLNQRVAKFLPSNKIYKCFLIQLLHSNFFLDHLFAIPSGTKQANLSNSEILRINVAIPPLDEQKAIAHYLDTKTAQIERKIDLLTQKATLYSNLKQSLINETVTRGLDKSVLMKDSGVKWLGEVPEGWRITHVKRICNKVTDGAHTSPDTSSEDYPFLTVVNLKNGILDFDNCLHTSNSDYQKLVRNGCKPKLFDVLYSKDGTISESVVICENKDFVVGSSFIILNPSKKNLNSKYFSYLLSSPIMRFQASIYVKGASLPRISIFNVAKLFCVVPPLQEQKIIADYLDTKTAHIDRIIQTINTQIEKLKELRKTLINDVVTGKIKVV